MDRVQSNSHYQELIGIPCTDINDETEQFREQGSFCGEVGDLVTRVCTDILRVPILVVTSIVGSPYVPFISRESIIDRPLYGRL